MTIGVTTGGSIFGSVKSQARFARLRCVRILCGATPKSLACTKVAPYRCTETRTSSVSVLHVIDGAGNTSRIFPWAHARGAVVNHWWVVDSVAPLGASRSNLMRTRKWPCPHPQTRAGRVDASQEADAPEKAGGRKYLKSSSRELKVSQGVYGDNVLRRTSRTFELSMAWEKIDWKLARAETASPSSWLDTSRIIVGAVAKGATTKRRASRA